MTITIATNKTHIANKTLTGGGGDKQTLMFDSLTYLF